VSDGELRKKGASSGACAGFALVKWLWSARETKTDVGVTGVIDLRGRLQAVGGIEEKTRTAKGEGDVRLMVMPEANFRYYAADDFAKVRSCALSCII
jgi:ATP-dependent Lon protease